MRAFLGNKQPLDNATAACPGHKPTPAAVRWPAKPLKNGGCENYFARACVCARETLIDLTTWWVPSTTACRSFCPLTTTRLASTPTCTTPNNSRGELETDRQRPPLRSPWDGRRFLSGPAPGTLPGLPRPSLSTQAEEGGSDCWFLAGLWHGGAFHEHQGLDRPFTHWLACLPVR